MARIELEQRSAPDALPNPLPVRQRRWRRYVVAPVATAAAVALVAGLMMSTGGKSSEVAGSGSTTVVDAATLGLGDLQRIASQGGLFGSGDVAYTRSQSVDVAHGSARTDREIWIATDGSGRIREVGSRGVEDQRFGPGGLYRVDFSGWPTTVDGVLAKLRGEAEQSGMRPVDAEAFVLAGDALRETTASPEVRSAIFGAVAKLQGVRSLGAVTDSAGRAGVGFAIDSDAAHNHSWQLVFDPATSKLLGERQGPIGSDWTSMVAYLGTELVDQVPPGGELLQVN